MNKCLVAILKLERGVHSGVFLIVPSGILHYREVFGGFDPEVVAKFDEKKVAALKVDEIIRQPEAKIRGVIENARHLLKVRMRSAFPSTLPTFLSSYFSRVFL